MTPEKLNVLLGFLGRLPAPLAARLANAVEADRLSEHGALPHDLILEGLRSALRDAHSGRIPGPLRLFSRPFEDLLSNKPRAQKQKGRIARASIVPVWQWISGTLLPQQAAAFVAETRTLILTGRMSEAMARTALFWAEASPAMCAALESEPSRKTARAILGSDMVVADAGEIALMLSAGPQVCELQDRLPRRLPNMTDEFLWMYRELYDRLAADIPDAAPFVAVMAMNRLEKPWEALRLPLMISRQTQDILISRTDMGLVGEILFADIEEHAAAIRAARPPVFDGAELAHHVDRFAEISNGLVKEVGVRRDGKWGQRLLSDRAAIAEVMEGFMERGTKEILSALATQKGSFGRGTRVPDVSRPVDPEKAARALNYARLIIGCRSSAASGSFAASQKEAFDKIAAELKLYIEEIVRELRECDAERRPRVEQHFELAASLTAILFSEEEADLLHRRARAALAA